MAKDNIILKAQENRSAFNPTINANTDIALTLISEVSGEKKEAIVNRVIAQHINEVIDSMDVVTLAGYSKEKKADAEAKQLALLVIANKLTE